MKKGDLYIANLTENVGAIQKGIRPVIIISNNLNNKYSKAVIVCALTSSKKKDLPTHVYIGKSGGLIQNSTILCEQIFTLDKSSLRRYIGSITDKHTIDRLQKGIRVSLDLQNPIA